MLTDYINNLNDLYGALLGTIFADGYIAPARIVKGRKNPAYVKEAPFEVSHTSKNLDYVQAVLKLIELIPGSKSHIKPKNKVLNNKTFLLYRLTTNSLKFFADIRNKIYKYVEGKRIKLFPKNMIYKLTDLGLYLLYLDDGTLKMRYYENSSRLRECRITFCLNSFTLDELKDFLYFLKDKYNIDSKYYKFTKSTTIGKNRGFVLWCNSENTRKFMQVIDKFYNEVPSMLYKFVKYYQS